MGVSSKQIVKVLLLVNGSHLDDIGLPASNIAYGRTALGIRKANDEFQIEKSSKFQPSPLAYVL